MGRAQTRQIQQGTVLAGKVSPATLTLPRVALLHTYPLCILVDACIFVFTG